MVGRHIYGLQFKSFFAQVLRTSAPHHIKKERKKKFKRDLDGGVEFKYFFTLRSLGGSYTKLLNVILNAQKYISRR